MNTKRLTRREFLRGAALTGVGLVGAACVVPSPIPAEAPAAAPTEAPTAAPAPPAKESIVVGMSRPLSGPLAIIGDSAFRPIYETWVPMVNDEGG
ncbi:MAG: twin-arginine translocation signal domain-containing protein, partial [candidate division Zixibacteria bacterium]|nr:twin-arginine translocation signal domain-containing protein [candidate division Zixibacteria bacterium]